LTALADCIAMGLSRLGVGRNDGVPLQLPNEWAVLARLPGVLAARREGVKSVDSRLIRSRGNRVRS